MQQKDIAQELTDALDNLAVTAVSKKGTVKSLALTKK